MGFIVTLYLMQFIFSFEIMFYYMSLFHQELTQVVSEKECRLKELSAQITEQSLLQDHADLKTLVDNYSLCENEKEALAKELEEKNKEVECLTIELKKKTYNLQGLVNTELWNKNKEIEKLNKFCERKHLEILALQKQLRDRSLLLPDKVTSFVSPGNLPGGIFSEVKENLQPHSDTTTQLQNLTEERRWVLFQLTLFYGLSQKLLQTVCFRWNKPIGAILCSLKYLNSFVVLYKI